MNELTVAQKAYLAGLIDGEGSVQIVRATTSYNRKSRRIYHQLRVLVFNNNYDMISWIKNAVGYGNIRTRKRQSPRHQKGYIYVATALKALEIVRAVYPYLIAKKKQADVAFLFGETIRKKSNNGCGRRGLEQSVVDFRESCKITMNTLNGNNGGHKLRLWKNNG